MLRPVKTVRATTKEEVDAALATADQVTVEGDDELLTYAVNRAAGDPTNRVALELSESPHWHPINQETYVRAPSPVRRAIIIAAAALIALLVITAAALAVYFFTHISHDLPVRPPHVRRQ
jgi:hypothetical protein